MVLLGKTAIVPPLESRGSRSSIYALVALRVELTVITGPTTVVPLA